jgi:integrase
MAIRQRTWEWKGKTKTAWVVDYFDLKGKRRLKTFKTKREAQDFGATTRVDINRGTHVADSDSITVSEAGKLWLVTGEENGLVYGSRFHNDWLLRLHIEPFLGNTKLSKLTVPAIREFESALRANGRSPNLVRRTIGGLGALLADAQERGLTMHNPVRDMRKSRGKRRTKGTKERKRQLAVGVDIPTPAEIRAVLGAATGFRRALFATAALAGLRASELRGLRWQDVDFAKATISVWQRADAWGTIDAPKSDAGYRTVPVAPLVVNALREWKLACPKGELGLVFPNGAGNVESLSNIVKRHWHPLQVAAGVSVPSIDKDGNPVMAVDDDGKPVLDDAGRLVPVMAPKYTGLHALRHFFCSWCAARPQDGGLGLPLKTVQVRMGHSTLAMTADRYGHLFPSQDDAEVLAAGERALMGA